MSRSIGPWIAGAGTLLLVWLATRKARAATPLEFPFAAPEPLAPLTYITAAERDARFGPIRFQPAPTSSNPEAIVITNGFESRLVSEIFPLIGRARVHPLAAPSLRAALAEIEARGLGSLIRSFNGSYNPRFVRKSQTTLSSHAYGTSIDVNAEDNPQGDPPTDAQRQIAPIFEKWGWYWGDRFRPTRDPMHFEFVGGGRAA